MDNEDEATFVMHLLHRLGTRAPDPILRVKVLLTPPLPIETKRILPFDYCLDIAEDSV